MTKIRTIRQAYEELKNNDPNTAITPHAIRRFILNGNIPAFMAGQKYLISMENLENYINNPQLKQREDAYGVIRPVNMK